MSSVCKFRCYVAPFKGTFRHQDHHMIQEIRHFIFDLLHLGILGGDDNFRRFFAHLLEYLIHPLVKQIICI